MAPARRATDGGSAGPVARVLAVAAAVLLLLTTGPSPGRAGTLLRAPSGAADPFAPVVALVSLIAWTVIAWLVVLVLLALGARLPGARGRLCAAVARRAAPRTVRRAVELALGLAVAAGPLGGLGPLGPTTALAAPSTSIPSLPPSTSAPLGLDLDWSSPGPVPVATPAEAAPPSATPAAATPTPARPRRPAPSIPTPPTTAPSTATSTGAATGTPPAAIPGTAPPAATLTRTPVVVRPGDTLWELAEERLRARHTAPTDAQVATAWPAWWAANRDAVGPDPDLLQPGTRLVPPA